MRENMSSVILMQGVGGNTRFTSLIFVSCDVTYRDTDRLAEITENSRCVRAVWDNLKSRLLITDLSNNRFFGREGSLNRVSFEFIRRM